MSKKTSGWNLRRISTASQKTDRQQEELTRYAEINHLNFNRNLDVFIDVVSGFMDGEERPNFSALKTKIALGEYRQVLFSEFSPYEFRIEKE